MDLLYSIKLVDYLKMLFIKITYFYSKSKYIPSRNGQNLIVAIVAVSKSDL